MHRAARMNNPTTLLLTGLAILGMYGAWNYATSVPAIDYFVAWAAADAGGKQSPHSIYTNEGRYRLGLEYREAALAEDPKSRKTAAASYRMILDSTATPFLYSVIGLIQTDDYEFDTRVWHFLSLMAFVLGLLLLGHLLGFPLATTLAIMLPALVWFDPVLSDLRVGNVNCIQFGLVAVIGWLASRPDDQRFVILAGFMAALLALFKPNLGPVAVILLGAWLMRGQLRSLLLGAGGMAFAGVFGLALTWWHFGTLSVWLEWLQQFTGLMQRMNYLAEKDSIGMTRLIPWDLSSVQQVAVTLGLCGVLLAGVFYSRRKAGLGWGVAQHPGESRVAMENLQLISFACVIQLLVSSLIWVHYYVLLIPLIMVCLRPWSNPNERGPVSVLIFRVLPVLAFLLMLDGPLLALTDIDYVDYLFYMTVAVMSILLFVLTWQVLAPDPYRPRLKGATEGIKVGD